MTKIKQAGNAHSLSKMFQIFAAVHKSMFEIWQQSYTFQNWTLIWVLTIKLWLHLKSVNLEAHLCSPSGSLPNKEERMVKNPFASSESYSEATIWAVIVDAFSRLTSKTRCIFTLSSFFPLSIIVFFANWKFLLPVSCPSLNISL